MSFTDTGIEQFFEELRQEVNEYEWMNMSLKAVLFSEDDIGARPAKLNTSVCFLACL